MRKAGLSLLLLAALVPGPAGGRASAQAPEAAQADQAAGASIFKANCASCHGPRGLGDGPMAGQLRYAPPDLTRLTARNRGRFPAELAARVIDGRDPVPGHGGPEMPIWGDAFLESRFGYSREQVKERIRLLVRHLETLQRE
ncbi:MAG: cytochrome c [Vicinamibacteria bacterium]